VLIAQMIGSAAISGATFLTSLTMFYALNAFGVLRVSGEGELEGLDLHEHGIPAYPEYALHSGAAPQGATGFASRAYDPAPHAGMMRQVASERR